MNVTLANGVGVVPDGSTVEVPSPTWDAIVAAKQGKAPDPEFEPVVLEPRATDPDFWDNLMATIKTNENTGKDFGCACESCAAARAEGRLPFAAGQLSEVQREGAWRRHVATLAERAAMPTPKPARTSRASNMDAADLLAKDIPPMHWAVQGILPEGLGILAAPPKAGKSLLAYQLAVELAFGHRLLGRDTEQRPVRYYALEDGERRSQERVRNAVGLRKLPHGLLQLHWTAPALTLGLEEEVAEYLDQFPLGVVIIDVLAKVRPGSARTTLNAYDADYQLLKDLQDVASDHPGASILVVTHDRKAGSDDFVTRITGTRGVSGSADYLIFINRERGKDIATIHVTGRDAADLTMTVRFTGTGWEVAAMADVMATAGETRQLIYRHVVSAGPCWPKAIAQATGLSEDVVSHRVADMVTDGQLVGGKGGYIVGDAPE